MGDFKKNEHAFPEARTLPCALQTIVCSCSSLVKACKMGVCVCALSRVEQSQGEKDMHGRRNVPLQFMNWS